MIELNLCIDCSFGLGVPERPVPSSKGRSTRKTEHSS